MTIKVYDKLPQAAKKIRQEVFGQEQGFKKSLMKSILLQNTSFSWKMMILWQPADFITLRSGNVILLAGSLYAKKPEENDMARKCCREPRKKLKRQVGKELNCLLNVVCHSFI